MITALLYLIGHFLYKYIIEQHKKTHQDNTGDSQIIMIKSPDGDEDLVLWSVTTYKQTDELMNANDSKKLSLYGPEYKNKRQSIPTF